MSEISQEKLIQIAAAAEKLVRCKGRYHSEQNYRALAALFGVTTPDLPPLEGEALRERAEPVAWRHDDGPFALGVLTRSKSVAENWAAKGWKITPLYTAPPAPVAAGWIACSERMPELNTRVLLYFPDYGGHIEDGCIGDEGDGHYHYFFDGDSLRHEPTHWMPLPEAPGKEG